MQQGFGLRFTNGGHASSGLGDVSRARGRPDLALQLYQAALRYSRDARDTREIAYDLGAIAGTLAAVGQFELAARLFGACQAYHERIALPFASPTFAFQRAVGLPEPWASAGTSYGLARQLFVALEPHTAAIRSIVLDDAEAHHNWTEGRGLALNDVISVALAAAVGSMPSRPRPGGLSPREIEVLHLLANGASNRANADHHSINQRTVDRPVTHILTKLDCDSRTAAATWAVREGLA